MNSYIDGLVKVELPEGFEELPLERLFEYSYIEGKPSAVFKDEERHIIIAVATAEVKGFLGGFAGSKDIAKGNEKKLRKPMEEYGYKLDCFYKRMVAGEKAECFRFTYTAKDTAMTGDSMCIKKGRNLIYMHAYYRTEMQKEGVQALDEFLSGVKIY